MLRLRKDIIIASKEPDYWSYTRKESHKYYVSKFEEQINSNQEYELLLKEVSDLTKAISQDSYNKELLKSYSNAIRFRFSSYYLYTRANSFKWLYKPTFRLYRSFLPILKDITPNGLLLYLFLNHCDDYDTDIVLYDFMSEMVIKKLFDLSDGQVKRAIENLIDINLITVTNTELPGIKRSYIIRLLPYYREKLDDGPLYKPQEKGIQYITLPKQLLLYYNKFNNKGSLKLYIHTCFYIDFKKGFHNRSVKTISEELNVGHYTVSKWFKDLTNNNLVKRFQMKHNISSETHLLQIPRIAFSIKFLKEKKEELQKELTAKKEKPKLSQEK